jgi:8-oxo-dGTP pyrophosphatase MutT (NUDIX family)
LRQAQLRERPRRAFIVEGEAVGSVDQAHLGALSIWPAALSIETHGVTLRLPVGERDDWLREANAALRSAGLIRAWRDEPFPLLSPSDERVLATMERAATRFWGTLTRGAHCNGWVAGADGRPAALWIATRSPTKPTDPGKLDNLIGGGVPHGQTPLETLVREGFEEAGLSPAQMARARTGSVIELHRDIPEGLQFERLHVFDLELRPDERPVNQDGEVASVECVPLEEALQWAKGDAMTVDAALVTLDFLVRHGIPGAAEDRAWPASALAALRRPVVNRS